MNIRYVNTEHIMYRLSAYMGVLVKLQTTVTKTKNISQEEVEEEEDAK